MKKYCHEAKFGRLDFYSHAHCVYISVLGCFSLCLRVRAYIIKDDYNPLQYSCLENPMDGGAW